MKKLALILIGLLLIVPAVYSLEIISRTAPEEIKLGDILEVAITITNPTDNILDMEISEQLPPDVEFIDPAAPTETKQYDALSFSILKWSVSLEAGETKTINYKIKPTALGEFSSPATEAKDTVTKQSYPASSDLTVMVKCSLDSTCGEGENYLNCPEDCAPSGKDGICNNAYDQVCDQDCGTGSDPDCKTGSSAKLILYIAGAIVLIIIILVILVIKKKSQQSL